jgi:serine/threonine protein kinase
MWLQISSTEISSLRTFFCFGDESLGLKAKLTDFGYSSVGVTDHDTVYPPCSRMWTAPEYHHRGFEVQAAKKIDVYNFGLVAVYLLFNDEVWDYYINIEEKIQTRKRNGGLLNRVKEVIASRNDNSRKRTSLEAFFEKTLSCNANARDSNLARLIVLLEESRY